MAMYLQYMLNKKLPNDSATLISKASINRIENSRTTLAAKHGLPGGYGLGNYTSYRNGFLFNGHNGGIDGFSSVSLYNREADLGIAISINKQANTRNLRQTILNYFIPENLENESNRTIEPISEEMIKNFDGFYEYKCPRNQLQAFIGNMIDCDNFIFTNDKVIVSNLFRETMDTLYHAGNNLFYSTHETVPFAVFFKNEQGITAIDLGGSYGEKSSLLWRWIKNICIWLSALLIIPYFLFGIIWLIIQLASKEKTEKRSNIILWLATLFFIVMAISFIASVESMDSININNPLNWLVFISSILFLFFLHFLYFKALN